MIVARCWVGGQKLTNEFSSWYSIAVSTSLQLFSSRESARASYWQSPTRRFVSDPRIGRSSPTGQIDSKMRSAEERSMYLPDKFAIFSSRYQKYIWTKYMPSNFISSSFEVLYLWELRRELRKRFRNDKSWRSYIDYSYLIKYIIHFISSLETFIAVHIFIFFEVEQINNKKEMRHKNKDVSNLKKIQR